MSTFLTLLKMNIRLLLRNKGFLFFLCITPIVSTVILGLKTGDSVYFEEEARSRILELENVTERAVYAGDTTAFLVKVYDASGTGLSEYVLEELTASGMYSVCRADAGGMTEEAVTEQAKKDAFDDRAGVLLYLKPDFDRGVLEGNLEEALLTYTVAEDERLELLEEELTEELSQLHSLSASTGMDAEEITEFLKEMEEQLPKKEVVSLSGKKDIALTAEQTACRDRIGYAFAIITLGFLFCGVCVAHTVIEEQENKVYTRIMLSGIGRKTYLGAKLVMALMISVLQTVILGICLFVAGNTDFGMNQFAFLLLIFLLGLIFSTASLGMGILLGDVMSSNYAVFALWSISALLAGLYFPLDSTSAVLKSISYLMPQKWFLRAAELLFVGDKSVYSMVICITVAYLIVILSVSGVGLKIRRADS
ncbi:MAG: ABC transporter permease [Roseburia sp.]|nr:ABC transporter permease [Roseburia sp.]